MDGGARLWRRHTRLVVVFGNEPAGGDDDPLAALPLDGFDSAETRQPHTDRNVEHAATIILDQRMAAAHVLHDPIRQNLFRGPGFTGRDLWAGGDRTGRLRRRRSCRGRSSDNRLLLQAVYRVGYVRDLG